MDDHIAMRPVGATRMHRCMVEAMRRGENGIETNAETAVTNGARDAVSAREPYE
jgi:hypothetical protein